MKKKFLYALFSILVLFSARIATAQSSLPPIIVWQKTIGGSGSDSLSAFCTGKDKSIVMLGSSNSAISGNKLQNAVGGYDYWVVKTDSLGNIIWSKTLGGTSDDVASAIIATSDGGYLVGGTSISDASGSKTANSFGFSNDYWILKLDADGNTVWNRTLGGLYTDILTSLAELPNGNFAAGGISFSDSNGIKTSKNIGAESTGDYWTLIIDKNGTLVAQNATGGTSDDALTQISPLGTDNIYSAGSSYSNRASGTKSQNTFGNNDYWLVRADVNGVPQSNADFGGNRSNYLKGMQVLSDNSVILGGYSNSDAGFSKSQPFLGVTDFWIVKLRPNGTQQWDKTIGGSLGDYLVSVQQTKDGGFLLGGYSNSNAGNNKTENSKGGYDYWIVKTDKTGNVVWDKTIGGNGNDILAGAYETDSNQYVIAGTSFSAQSGDKDAGAIGSSDYWVVRLNGNQSVLPVQLLSFAGKIQQQDVWLNWSVTAQANTSRFEIERSTDGSTFNLIATVSATGSTAMQAYQSVDAKAALLPFSKLYYRLKIVNSDGTFTYSNVVFVQLLSLVGNSFTVMPNPVKDVLTMQYHTATDEKANVTICTPSGKVVFATVLPPSTTGTSTHTFNVAGLSRGIYYVNMFTGDKTQKTTKVVIKE